MARFSTYFFLALLVLVVPTWLYMAATSPSFDLVEYDPDRPAARPASNAQKIKDKAAAAAAGAGAGRLFHPPGQVSQGHGPAPAGKGGSAFTENCLFNPAVGWKDLWACKQKVKAAEQLKASASPVAPAAAAPQASEEVKLSPDTIMGKMGNATAKAALGRATWHFLHTMTLRYPEHPSASEQTQLRDFITLFSHLYPCGECASHFQQLLARYPPQVGSRKSASLWLCSVHNAVNERLKKPQFDCGKLDETYDCGCGIDDGPLSVASLTRLAREKDGFTPRPKSSSPPKPKRTEPPAQPAQLQARHEDSWAPDWSALARDVSAYAAQS